MEKYIQIIENSYIGYWNYLVNEIVQPSPNSYFYWLFAISLLFFLLEQLIPWRKNQPRIREDFWLDAFYMFFNFFLFSLIAFNALSNIFVQFFNDFIALFNIKNFVATEIQTLPNWLSVSILFIFKDFIGYCTHRFLHKNNFFWQFHKTHHSVKQMGFAAHLRFHWMENIIYKTIEYIPLTILGYGLLDFFTANIVAITIGHFNHSNLKFPLGPLRYLFNNPQMHIWHHAKNIPKNHQKGVNFGLSLSVWDYLFKTNYVPQSGRDLELGFEGDEDFPKTFIKQEFYFGKSNKI